MGVAAPAKDVIHFLSFELTGRKGIMKSFAAGVLFAVATAYAGGDGQEGFFPFLISYGGATNATSVAHFLDAPAGRHGFVRVQGDSFVTDAGAIRFHATNFTGPANFPSHADAEACFRPFGAPWRELRADAFHGYVVPQFLPSPQAGYFGG